MCRPRMAEKRRACVDDIREPLIGVHCRVARSALQNAIPERLRPDKSRASVRSFLEQVFCFHVSFVSSSVFGIVRFDVDQRGSVDTIEPSNDQSMVLDRDQFHDARCDRIRPDRRTQCKCAETADPAARLLNQEIARRQVHIIEDLDQTALRKPQQSRAPQVVDLQTTDRTAKVAVPGTFALRRPGRANMSDEVEARVVRSGQVARQKTLRRMDLHINLRNRDRASLPDSRRAPTSPLSPSSKSRARGVRGRMRSPRARQPCRRLRRMHYSRSPAPLRKRARQPPPRSPCP